MGALHILNKGIISHPAIQDCLCAFDKKEDALLLIEDGVYLSQSDLLQHQADQLFCLQHDLHLRGLSPASRQIKIIDDAEFVSLCTKYEKIVSWF
jgi:sulfur relay protein TusB/DsrH